MPGVQMLQHAWTYKPMVHDVLGMQANSITIEEKGSTGVLPGASTKKRYEVSPHSLATSPVMAEVVMLVFVDHHGLFASD